MINDEMRDKAIEDAGRCADLIRDLAKTDREAARKAERELYLSILAWVGDHAEDPNLAAVARKHFSAIFGLSEDLGWRDVRSRSLGDLCHDSV